MENYNAESVLEAQPPQQPAVTVQLSPRVMRCGSAPIDALPEIGAEAPYPSRSAQLMAVADACQPPSHLRPLCTPSGRKSDAPLHSFPPVSALASAAATPSRLDRDAREMAAHPLQPLQGRGGLFTCNQNGAHVVPQQLNVHVLSGDDLAARHYATYLEQVHSTERDDQVGEGGSTSHSMSSATTLQSPSMHVAGSLALARRRQFGMSPHSSNASQNRMGDAATLPSPQLLVSPGKLRPGYRGSTESGRTSGLHSRRQSGGGCEASLNEIQTSQHQGTSSPFDLLDPDVDGSPNW